MKWIIFAVFAACLTWYFANETLQTYGLAVVQNGEWKVIANSWHIFGKLWPAVLIIFVGTGLTFALVLPLFFFSEEKQNEEFEKRLDAANSKNIDLISNLHSKISLEKKNVTDAVRQIKKAHFENEELVRKINHQHATIQRLHKKIDR